MQTRTITSTQVTTYTYDAANRLSAVGGQPYTWDSNGNLTNDGSTLYRYDQANRMISTTLSGATSLFNYTGDGARLRQIIAGVPTTYTQDIAAPLPVVLQAKTGTTATQYLYSMGTRPVAQYTSSAWQYLLPDALGSVRQIADASGNISLTESYQPYGALLNSSGSGSSIFAYSGEQIDQSGLIYLRARYMQPGLGIFLSHDPYSGNPMQPQSMNGWGYVEGNPVNLTDPSGYDPCKGLDEARRGSRSVSDFEQCQIVLSKAEPDTTSNWQVLQSTIQVVPVINPDPCVKPTALGRASLGTLVQHQGVFWLYSHNHYYENVDIFAQANRVAFFNAVGEYLGDTSGDDFRSRLVTAQDAGNAVMVAPKALLPDSFTSSNLILMPQYAEFGDPQQLLAGYTSLESDPSRQGVPHIQSIKAPFESGWFGGLLLGVIEGAVAGEVEIDGVPSLMVYSVNAKVTPGDSGGGTWFRGRVIGNTFRSTFGRNQQGPYDTNQFFSAQLPARFRQ